MGGSLSIRLALIKIGSVLTAAAHVLFHARKRIILQARKKAWKSRLAFLFSDLGNSMKYIVIIHKDPDSCYGITIPDYPGCFSTADSFDDIPAKVQEALECWAYGDDSIPAAPSSYEKVASLDEAKDGMLMVVDLNFDFADKKTVPVNVTMPKYMRSFIDSRARELGLSRSAFLQKAAQEYREPIPS